jgi:flagellar assembly protein FliH
LPEAERKKFLFKNIYNPQDYTIVDHPYKLRGVFLPKTDQLKQASVKKEETPSEKAEKLEDKIAGLNGEIRDLEKNLQEMREEYNNFTGRAEEDAKNLLEQAAKDAEELKQIKAKIGYEEGLDKGYNEGIEKGKLEIITSFSKLVETTKAIADSALAEKNRIISETEEGIVSLSVDIARKVVNAELTLNKSVVINFVKEAILKLEDKSKITIFCNPDDIELVKSSRQKFMELTDAVDSLHILPDDMLESGECRIESKSEIIDTDLNYQFGEIKKKLSTGG